MTNLMHYLLEANIYLTATWGCYWLLLKRQTFYNANRAYLLISSALCFVIPLVQISPTQSQLPPHAKAQATVIFTPVTQTITTIQYNEPLLTPFKALESIYIGGAIVVLILFALKLYRLLKLISGNQNSKKDGYTLVSVAEAASPFSFFNYLFTATETQLPAAVLRHELVHIRQKHSADLVFTELIKVFCWFNPVIYLLQSSLKALHEFEADRQASGNDTGKDWYVDFLIGQAHLSNGVPFANQFSNQQLLKSRIMKIYQKRSGKLARLYYLLAVPLCAGLLFMSSAAFSKNYGWIKINLNNHKKSNLKYTTSTDTTHKKLRLKVTSGSVTGITDRLELKGINGEKLIYTAQNLTANDQKQLMQKFGIKVETTSASATTTSIMVPPPPPPMAPAQPQDISTKKLKTPPPPPPPVEAPAKGKQKAAAVKFAAPTTTDGNTTAVAGTKPSQYFKELHTYMRRSLRYPEQARKSTQSGSVWVSFTVNEKQEITNEKITKGTTTILDDETLNNLLAYKGNINATPGAYTLCVTYQINDGNTTVQKPTQESPTAGEIVVTGYL